MAQCTLWATGSVALNWNMASAFADRCGELNDLFRDISSNFSSVEAAEVVKSSKRIYGEQFESLENEDLHSCLNLFLKLGYVSNGKLRLIRDFVASKSKNEGEIKKVIDNYIKFNPLQVDSEKQMQMLVTAAHCIILQIVVVFYRLYVR